MAPGAAVNSSPFPLQDGLLAIPAQGTARLPCKGGQGDIAGSMFNPGLLLAQRCAVELYISPGGLSAGYQSKGGQNSGRASLPVQFHDILLLFSWFYSEIVPDFLFSIKL